MEDPEDQGLGQEPVANGEQVEEKASSANEETIARLSLSNHRHHNNHHEQWLWEPSYGDYEEEPTANLIARWESETTM